MSHRRRLYKAWLLSFAVAPDPPITIDDWIAASGITTLTTTATLARCTKNATSADNPRISRRVSGLIGGASYAVNTTVYRQTASGSVFFRVHDTEPELRNSPYLVNFPCSDPTTVVTPQTFTAPMNGICYIGIVPVCDTSGQFSETDLNFTIVRV